MDENQLRYAATHEWVRHEGEICTVGVTRYAIEQLTDIVYMELPAVGKTVAVGEAFGFIETVKAVSDVYAPVAGQITAVNEALAASPSRLSDDPYGASWLVKIATGTTPNLSHLMDKAGYDASTAAHG